MGRGIYPVLSFPSLPLHVRFPAPPHLPKCCPFPRARSKAKLKHPVGAWSISTAVNPALLFQKCVHYWPEKEGTYGPFTIHVQGVSECVEYVLRDLSIQVGWSSIPGSEGEPAGASSAPTPPRFLSGWQRCVMGEQRVGGWESWVCEPPARGRLCRAPACRRGPRGRRTQP